MPVDFDIVCNSSCDLKEAEIKSNNITVVPFSVTLDGETYLKDGIDITRPDFYRRLREEQVYPKTSVPSTYQYVTAFKNILEKDKNVLCICISSKLSSSYQVALNARAILKPDFSNREIYVYDSLQVSIPEGYLSLKALQLKQSGHDIETILHNLDQIKEKSGLFISIDNLNYLEKGGRISKLKYISAGLLNLKPVLHFKNGEIKNFATVRGTHKAHETIINGLLDAINNNISSYEFFGVHADCEDKLNLMLKQLQSRIPIRPINNYELSVTVGAHSGPTPIGLAYAYNPKI